MAGDARGRRGRTLLHRRCLGLGEVREVGRDRAQDAPQSALPLDPPGAEAAVGHQRPAAGSRDRRGNLGRVQRPAGPRRFLLPRHHAADERGAGLHDRRPDRHAGISRGDRGRPGRFRSRCCPRSGPIGRWPSTSPAAFNAWVDRLAEVSGIEIGDNFERFLEALQQRHDFFHAAGCRLSDHGLETPMRSTYTARSCGHFRRAPPRRPAPRRTRSPEFRSALLYEFALWDHEKGWTQQFHLGALRNNNTRHVPAAWAGHGLRLDRRRAVAPGRWRGSSTAWTAPTTWPRRSSTTSTRPTTRCWPR